MDGRYWFSDYIIPQSVIQELAKADSRRKDRQKMDAVTYLKEKNRMCAGYDEFCHGCPLGGECDDTEEKGELMNEIENDGYITNEADLRIQEPHVSQGF